MKEKFAKVIDLDCGSQALIVNNISKDNPVIAWFSAGADSAYDIVISKILSLLPKERQDIEEAYEEGSYMNCQRHQFPPFTKQASDYFNQNFTQDITNQVK